LNRPIEDALFNIGGGGCNWIVGVVATPAAIQ